jgi:hypothetical protein
MFSYIMVGKISESKKKKVQRLRELYFGTYKFIT